MADGLRCRHVADGHGVMRLHENPVGEQPDPTELVIPLHAEQVEVERVRRETGKVRVATKTETHEQLIEEVLSGVRARVVRVDIGTMVDVMPDVREEGDTTIIPVVEEVLVIEKRLMLKEEIRITRERTSSVHSQTVLLRKQHAVVTRTHGEQASIPAQPNMDGKQDG